MRANVAVYLALVAFGAGLLYRVSGWFRHALAPDWRAVGAWKRVTDAARGIAASVFSREILTLLRSLWRDVLLQRRLFAASRARWAAHLAIFLGFAALTLVHALGQSLVPRYQSTTLPHLFLRDLLGLSVLAGLVAATFRRLSRNVPRRETSPDAAALFMVAIVLLSGLLLEATKIGSRARHRNMVEQYGDAAESTALEAYWGAEMGTVLPGAAPSPALVARGREAHQQRCAGCHDRPQWAFMGYSTASLLRPLSPWLDGVNTPGVLWTIHFYGCLVGLVLLPFTKLFHLVATPVCLLVNGVVAGGDPRRPRLDPAPQLPAPSARTWQELRSSRTERTANAATRRMLELDACTHCCACSARCSMAMASDAFGNDAMLPSVKIGALRALARGGPLNARQLRALQEGVLLCTSCDRCTASCPSGIDLLDLWRAAREALLDRGLPGYELLSPLSFRRWLAREEMEPGDYREATDAPRWAIAERFDAALAQDRSQALRPGDGRTWSALRSSLQASTFSYCFGCKTCSTACPVVRREASPQRTLGLVPHQIMYAARLRLWNLVLGSRMLWDCLGCYQCQDHCPQGVGVTDVIYELKNVALARVAASDRRETPP